MGSGNSNLETRTLLDELRSFDKGGFFDLGHPLLNRIAESFVKAAGVTFSFSPISLSLFLLYVRNETKLSPLLCTFYTHVHIQIGAVQAVSREAYFTAFEGTHSSSLCYVCVNVVICTTKISHI